MHGLPQQRVRLGAAFAGRQVKGLVVVDRIDRIGPTNSVISTIWVEGSSSALSSSLVKVT